MFVAAVLAFVLGLLVFLREIFLATATVQIGIQHVPMPPRRGGDGGLPRG